MAQWEDPIDWWADPVKAIYVRAIAALGGGESAYDAMHYGPAHVVWDDSNLEDGHIRYCLEQCDKHRQEFVERFDEVGLEIVRASLVELLAIPEDERGDDSFDDDDDEEPSRDA